MKPINVEMWERGIFNGKSLWMVHQIGEAETELHLLRADIVFVTQKAQAEPWVGDWWIVWRFIMVPSVVVCVLRWWSTIRFRSVLLVQPDFNPSPLRIAAKHNRNCLRSSCIHPISQRGKEQPQFISSISVFYCSSKNIINILSSSSPQL